MKKTLAILLASVITAGCALMVSAYDQGDPVEIPEADYPGSVNMYDWAEGEGQILMGTFYYRGTEFGDGYSAAEAVDGDYTTFYAAGDGSYSSTNQLIMQMDTPYQLTEIRFFGRDGKFERTVGLCFDASNDGENWTHLYETAEPQSEEDYDYVSIKASELAYTGGFTYFRVHQIDDTMYFNLGEVEWWGTPAAASTDAPADEVDGEEQVTVYTYPNSGYTNGTLITGTVIGPETGYDGSTTATPAQAFDGDPRTYYDPYGVGDGYCGIDAGSPVTLSSVLILSRSGWTDRTAGAMIQGSNDGENWTTLYTHEGEGDSTNYIVVQSFENNTGYSMYRYYNETNHGDVAEVEFYTGGVIEETAAETTETAEETAAEAVTETAETAAEAVETAVDTAVETVTETAETAAEAVEEAVTDAAETVADTAEAAADTVTDTAEAVTDAASDAVNTASEKTGAPVVLIVIIVIVVIAAVVVVIVLVTKKKK